MNMALAKVMRCLRFLLVLVYYHLCNNRCGGVNGRLNCQTESKISAADKMGGGKLNPTMKKNFLSQILWNTSKKLFFLIFYFLFL